MPSFYAVICPAVPDHRVDWTPVPQTCRHLPLMAPGKPGRNPELVQALRRCPSCIVRLIMRRAS
jgi:hypothetical protein